MYEKKQRKKPLWYPYVRELDRQPGGDSLQWNLPFYGVRRKGKKKTVLDMLPYLHLGYVADPSEMQSDISSQGPICPLADSDLKPKKRVATQLHVKLEKKMLHACDFCNGIYSWWLVAHRSCLWYHRRCLWWLVVVVLFVVGGRKLFQGISDDLKCRLRYWAPKLSSSSFFVHTGESPVVIGCRKACLSPTTATSGKHSVGCRWVYTIKIHLDGSVERLKAQLVAGYTQTYGIDYDETFSPVAKISSIHVLISLSANLDWPLFQLDVKNAFLHDDLNEEVYMEQPPGFVAQGEYRGIVCKLKKTLYGLKQSPQAWFGRFSDVVLAFDLH
ncbi:uncharacterized protein LOC118349584 [Juglans regia]|uniref:Uncharacterized protein LOC118349584 n=1 Tax=Juglans regia TaxID=51240 RepID=A0A6P9F446_JUGRE|nr:uncharacterized protein LOC118349584 [Juglans regia]